MIGKFAATNSRRYTPKAERLHFSEADINVGHIPSAVMAWKRTFGGTAEPKRRLPASAAPCRLRARGHERAHRRGKRGLPGFERIQGFDIAQRRRLVCTIAGDRRCLAKVWCAAPDVLRQVTGLALAEAVNWSPV